MISANFFIKEVGLILRILDNIDDFILVSVGAIFGVNIRIIIYQKLQDLNKNYKVLLINIFSSFLLGLFLSLFSKFESLAYSYQLGLFFSVGVLGSLSTFSTFIYDSYELIVQVKFDRALKLIFISITLGVLFFKLGFLLGL